MFSINVFKYVLRQKLRQNFFILPRNCTSDSAQRRDPYPVFKSANVQEILKRVSGFDVVKASKRIPEVDEKPKYELLSDRELVEKGKVIGEEVRKKIWKFPPFMAARTRIDTTIQEDSDLAEFDTAKYIFTDITFGLSNRERIVTVREPSGQLRKASWEERDRVNNIYNPLPGQIHLPPVMFAEENLERVLRDDKVLYVLDRACAQYEPDDPEFIRVTHRTYEFLNSTGNFDALRATRHFGPFVFYLVWYKKVTHLLIDKLQRELLQEAVDVIHLFTIVNPQCQTAKLPQLPQDPLNVIKEFCKLDCGNSAELELSIQAFEDSISPKVKTSA